MFKKTRIITHSGTFHSDEVFAVATLKMFLEQKYKNPRIGVVRTRDLSIIKKGDYVIDIGMKYDPVNLFFDHHQEGNEKRENGIPFAAFGLVWKEFGEKICGSQEIANNINRKIVQPIDAMDNGISLFKLTSKKINPYMFYDVVDTYNFISQKNKDKLHHNFMKMVDLAKDILLREIERAVIQEKHQKEILEIYNKTEDKRLIIFDKSYDDFVVDIILGGFEEPVFIIKPNNNENKEWKLKAIRTSKDSFENKKDLPLEWAGKRDEELQKITGVSDAVFCHNGRFIAVAKSKEGALSLAKLALKH